ncbi:MAG: DHH family phosphoesterase [Chloroflexota bacterium]
MHPAQEPDAPALSPATPAAALIDLLRRASHVAAVCHRNPDADTIGAAVAVVRVARAMGTSAELVALDAIPRPFDFLTAGVPVRRRPSANPDVVVVCDAANLDRIGDDGARAPWLSGARIVNIDHHVTNDGYGDLRLVDTSAAATCEVLALALTSAGVDLDAATASALLAGIVRDSDGFSTSQTSPTTLRLAASLVEAGAVLQEVHQQVLSGLPPRALRLWGMLLEQLQAAADGRVVSTILRRRMLELTGAEDHQADGVVEHVARSPGVDVTILLREMADGRTRVSVRTGDSVDATRLVAAMGGGGHARRAGAITDLPADAARDAVVAQAERQLRKEA